jgi:hypothetical protein
MGIYIGTYIDSHIGTYLGIYIGTYLGIYIGTYIGSWCTPALPSNFQSGRT